MPGLIRPRLADRSSVDRLVWFSILVLAVLQVGVHLGNRFGSDYLWDLYVYVRAADDVQPYRTDERLLFVYPPFTLDAFRQVGTHLFETMLVAYTAATVWFAQEYAQLAIRRRGEVLLAALGLGGLGVVTLKSGNLTGFMHLALLAAVLRSLRRSELGSSGWLYLVTLFSLVKPYFVVYGLLGLVVAPGRARRELARFAGVASAGTGVYALYWHFRPDDMRAFVRAVEWQAFTHSDFGSSPFGQLLTITGSQVAAFTGYIVVAAGMAALALWAAGWSEPTDARQRLTRLMLGYAVLSFTNPRVHAYDLAPVVLCLLVAGVAAGGGSAVPIAALAALAMNAVPPAIYNFAARPFETPYLLREATLWQLLGVAVVFTSVAFEMRLRGRPSRAKCAATVEAGEV